MKQRDGDGRKTATSHPGNDNPAEFSSDRQTRGDAEPQSPSGAIGRIKNMLRPVLRYLVGQHRDLSEEHTNLARELSRIQEHLCAMQSEPQQAREFRPNPTEDDPPQATREEFETLTDQVRSLEATFQGHGRHMKESEAVTSDRLDGLTDALEELKKAVHSRTGSIAQALDQGPDLSLLEQVGSWIPDYDRLLEGLERLSVGCPEECFARRLADEMDGRLRGMRAQTHNLLRMQDVELIESVETFRPAFHQPVGTCPRPDGADGDGRLEEVGLLYRAEGKEKVIRPALVTLFDDVEITFAVREGG